MKLVAASNVIVIWILSMVYFRSIFNIHFIIFTLITTLNILTITIPYHDTQHFIMSLDQYQERLTVGAKTLLNSNIGHCPECQDYISDVNKVQRAGPGTLQ